MDEGGSFRKWHAVAHAYVGSEKEPLAKFILCPKRTRVLLDCENPKESHGLNKHYTHNKIKRRLVL